MTDLRAEAAAWQAAQSLRDVLMLLNATDLDENDQTFLGLPSRLAAGGRGTAWESTETALRLVLTALLTEDTPAGTDGASRANSVIDSLYDSGESVKWCVAHLQREEKESLEAAIANRLEDALEAAPNGLTPSAAGRAAKVTTDVARTVLQWMVKQQYAHTDGNGAWTRYFAGRA